MCDKDHFAESVAEYEARGLVTADSSECCSRPASP